MEKRPVHPGEAFALVGVIKYELGWTFLDNRKVHASGMRQKRAVKLNHDVKASRRLTT
ncbi:MAG: hypothetical protein SWK90_19665 [Chloroflexota bacterium]|nr:hypothetical protein [Chloroflexota bacterium]